MVDFPQIDDSREAIRNTVIEDYHADGKLSDAEMKAFNLGHDISQQLGINRNSMPAL